MRIGDPKNTFSKLKLGKCVLFAFFLTRIIFFDLWCGKWCFQSISRYIYVMNMYIFLYEGNRFLDFLQGDKSFRLSYTHIVKNNVWGTYEADMFPANQSYDLCTKKPQTTTNELCIQNIYYIDTLFPHYICRYLSCVIYDQLQFCVHYM